MTQLDPPEVRYDDVNGVVEDVGSGHALLHRDVGHPRFRHVCTVPDPERADLATIVAAPTLDPHNVRTRNGRTTVTPSILCSRCGTHGFITRGVWRSA